jgi:hypothetical protein
MTAKTRKALRAKRLRDCRNSGMKQGRKGGIRYPPGPYSITERRAWLAGYDEGSERLSRIGPTQAAMGRIAAGLGEAHSVLARLPFDDQLIITPNLKKRFTFVMNAITRLWIDMDKGAPLPRKPPAPSFKITSAGVFRENEDAE